MLIMSYFQIRHFVEINLPAATNVSSTRIGYLVLRKQLSSIGSPVVCQTNMKQVLLAFLLNLLLKHTACGPVSGLQTAIRRTFLKMPQLLTGGDRCHAVTILAIPILVVTYSGNINYNLTIHVV
jgi:hypothetical protein